MSDRRTWDALRTALESHGITMPMLGVISGSGRYNEYIDYFPIEGNHAIDVWHTLRAVVDETGKWPVLFGDHTGLVRHVQAITEDRARPTAALVEAALSMDVPRWIEDELKAGEEDRFDEESDGTDTWRGAWPEDAQPYDRFSIPYDVRSGEPLPLVYVGLVPTTTSWHVPGFLRFGGWNACPDPTLQTAVLRHWQERYGAEVVGISGDVIDMRVVRPPQTRDAALQLAYEQYAYCNDIVYQGTGTLDALAAELLNGSAWYFWWD